MSVRFTPLVLSVWLAAAGLGAPASAQTTVATPAPALRVPSVKGHYQDVGTEKLQDRPGGNRQLCVSKVGDQPVLLVPDDNRLVAVTPDDRLHVIDLAALTKRSLGGINAVTEWNDRWVVLDGRMPALLLIEKRLDNPKIMTLPLSSEGEFQSTGLVAVKRQGRDVLLTTGANEVYAIDVKTRDLTVYAGNKEVDGEIQAPALAKDIALKAASQLVRHGDWIYLTDRWNGSVSRLNPDKDQFEPYVGHYTQSRVKLPLRSPQGLFSYGRQLLVTDAGYGTIFVVDDASAKVYSLGAPAADPAQPVPFEGVAAMAGRIYATTADHRIVRFVPGT